MASEDYSSRLRELALASKSNNDPISLDNYFLESIRILTGYKTIEQMIKRFEELCNLSKPTNNQS